MVNGQGTGNLTKGRGKVGWERREQSTRSIQIFVSNTIPAQKESGLLGEMTHSKTGARSRQDGPRAFSSAGK